MNTRDPRIPFSIPYTTAASVFISGTRAVSAAIAANRRQLYKLHYAEPSSRPTPERTSLLSRAKSINVPISNTSMGFLDALTGKLNKKADDLIHDGVILEASALPQKPITFLSTTNPEESSFSFRLGVQTREEAAITGTSTSLPYTSERWRQPFLLWLHGIVDTRNLGAIARTALYFGVDALILTQRATASADNAFALRSSAGALEYLPVLTVPPTTTPDDFVTASQKAGWHFIGAVAPPSKATAHATTNHAFLHEMRANPVEEKPTVLVLGNEDQGLPAGLVKKMDGQVSIRGPKAEARRAGLDSLNVGIAGAVLCEWFLARRSGLSLMREKRVRDEEKVEGREEQIKEAKEKLF
jgi:21S rRNA (GM2251-2'-O)-methyltransferase